MNLIEYHKEINNYITGIYLYQIFLKPLNKDLIKINPKNRLKLETLLMLYSGITVATKIAKLLTKKK